MELGLNFKLKCFYVPPCNSCQETGGALSILPFLKELKDKLSFKEVIFFSKQMSDIYRAKVTCWLAEEF